MLTYFLLGGDTPEVWLEERELDGENGERIPPQLRKGTVKT